MDPFLYQQFSEIESTHWWFRARRQIIADTLRQHLAPAGASTRRILDVGCGTGGMLPVLAEFGRVTGLEVSTDAVAWARKQHEGDIEVVQGTIPDDIGDGPWDVITAFDVIEHLDDDIGALHRMREALGPGGQVVISVPAYMFLWSPHDDLNLHKRRYTRRLLVDRLENAGFRVQRSSYFNTWLLPVVAAVRLAKRAGGRASSPADSHDAAPIGESDFSLPGPRLNEVLRRVFASERFALRRATLPAGVSILAVAQRD